MNEPQSLDNWIFNYESAQKHKHQLFLKALKHEFIERTTQQRRDRDDRVNQINTTSTEGMERTAKVRRGRPTAQHQGI